MYSIECRECTKEGKESKYYGETARTGWERSREHFTLLENYPDKSALGDHIREEHNNRPCDFSMKLVSKHFKPLERQCKEGLMIGEYEKGKIMNRRGEWGENLPPDFGVLEDTIYKVKRKSTNPQQRSDKSKKLRLEVCEALCETDAGGALALTTNGGRINTNDSTQHTDFLHVKTDSAKCETRNQENISNWNLPSETHISCGSIKLANGKHGCISGFFEKVVRHSGVNSGSEKIGQCK